MPRNKTTIGREEADDLPVDRLGEPVRPDVPADSTPYLEFEKEEARRAALAVDRNPPGPIETRDNRGSDIDESGKYKERIPIHQIDDMAKDMADSFARDIERVYAETSGDDLTVTLTTRHGTAKATTGVSNWTEAGVKKALDEIKKKLTGPAEDTDDPDKKLADAVRAAVKA